MQQNTQNPQSAQGTAVRKGYPGDIRREQFAPIKPLFKNARKLLSGGMPPMPPGFGR